MKTAKNPRGQKVPVLTVADLVALGARRRDATMYEIWPAQGKLGKDVFYFDPGNGDLRPSVIVRP